MQPEVYDAPGDFIRSPQRFARTEHFDTKPTSIQPRPPEALLFMGHGLTYFFSNRSQEGNTRFAPYKNPDGWHASPHEPEGLLTLPLATNPRLRSKMSQGTDTRSQTQKSQNTSLRYISPCMFSCYLSLIVPNDSSQQKLDPSKDPNMSSQTPPGAPPRTGTLPSHTPSNASAISEAKSEGSQPAFR